MTDYTTYKPEDFLADESFGDHLLKKNQQSVLFWQNWILDNPDCSASIKEAEFLFFILRTQDKKANQNGDVKNNYAKFFGTLQNKDTIQKANATLPIVRNISKTRTGFRKAILWAASAAAVLLISVAAWMFSTLTKSAAPKFIAYAESADQPNLVTLEDGTVVHLNSHSSISVSKDYNKDKREISLKGSAFFKVSKDRSKPFIVTSGNIKTTALGTSFYVYNINKENTSVSLLEGKVRVEGYKNSVELAPGEKALVDGDSTIYKKGFESKQLQDFILGKVSFNQASLDQITTVLAEYYNMKVEVKGKGQALNFTGSFDVRNIHEILDAIEFTYNIHYTINGQNITLSFN